jgi:hypothetical protein
LLFAASFVFFFGPHGPTGPMLVLAIVNFPVHWTAQQIVHRYGVPFSGSLWQIGASVLVVAINGYLYGVVAEALVNLRRRTQRRSSGEGFARGV